MSRRTVADSLSGPTVCGGVLRWSPERGADPLRGEGWLRRLAIAPLPKPKGPHWCCGDRLRNTTTPRPLSTPRHVPLQRNRLVAAAPRPLGGPCDPSALRPLPLPRPPSRCGRGPKHRFETARGRRPREVESKRGLRPPFTRRSGVGRGVTPRHPPTFAGQRFTFAVDRVWAPGPGLWQVCNAVEVVWGRVDRFRGASRCTGRGQSPTREVVGGSARIVRDSGAFVGGPPELRRRLPPLPRRTLLQRRVHAPPTRHRSQAPGLSDCTAAAVRRRLCASRPQDRGIVRRMCMGDPPGGG